MVDIEIRTFSSFEEIKELDGFKFDNPVDKKNYSTIIGDYVFQDEVKCCFLKDNGNLCGTEHKYGFVTLLKDNSITIIGNHCANEKFDAKSKFKADRSKYINEKRRLKALSVLAELLSSKDKILSRLDAARIKLESVRERISLIKPKLGEYLVKELIDMNRTGNSNVTVIAFSYKKYQDDDGNEKIETTKTEHTIGRLQGYQFISNRPFASFSYKSGVVIDAFVRAEHDCSSARIREVDSLISDLRQIDEAEVIVHRVETDFEAFLANDFSLFCYLVSDKSQRYKLAQLALSQQNESSGKDKAKDWLAGKDRSLRKTLGADKIKIN